jgi:tRNA G10  N-methylase Trm11
MTEVRLGLAQQLEEALRALVPSSPKRPKRQSSSDQTWFNYYAGYADAFVEDVIGAFAGHTTTVLDPWNGAGTTTAAAARAGLGTIGLDINPAAVVIAKARLLMSDVEASLSPLVDDVVIHARQGRDTAEKTDLLLKWLDPATATSVRRLERSISKLTVSSEGRRLTAPGAIDEISSLAALFYLALFRTTRDLLAPFFTSNPTWIRLRVKPTSRLRISFDALAERFIKNVLDLQKIAKANESPTQPQQTQVSLGSSSRIPLLDGSVTAVLTSPPYCTRIDYAVATLPELAVLGYDWQWVEKLRSQLIGTPTILDENDKSHENAVADSDTLRKLISRIGRHKSYAAQSYYLPFYSQYFQSMSDSLSEINRVTRAGSPIVFVVQDSWFKDVHVATPTIISELAQSIGWRVIGEHPFDVKTRAAAHPHRATRRTSRAVETVSVYSR